MTKTYRVFVEVVSYTSLIGTRTSRTTPDQRDNTMRNTFAFNGFANLVLAATPLMAVAVAILTKAAGVA